MANEQARSLVENIEPLIEILLPRAIESVVSIVSVDDAGLNMLRRDHTVNFTSGVADIPNEGIKEAYADSMYVVGDENAVYYRVWRDFNATPDGNNVTSAAYAGRLHIKNDKIYYKTTAGDASGSKTINCVTVPQLPATMDTDFDCPDRLLDQIIAVTAGLVMQQVPVEQVAADAKTS